LRSHRVPSIEGYRETASHAWDSIPFTAVEMIPAPLEMQNNEYVSASWTDRRYGETTRIQSASVHDGRQIAIRVRWPSQPANAGTGEGFSDAVAIALPVRTVPALHSMGSPEEPIHFLQWMARRNTIRSVLAEGIGSSRAAASVAEAVRSGWSAGTWTVVFSRAIAASAELSSLAADTMTNIGFAVWNGGNEERAGIKAVSTDWMDLRLDP